MTFTPDSILAAKTKQMNNVGDRATLTYRTKTGSQGRVTVGIMTGEFDRKAGWLLRHGCQGPFRLVFRNKQRLDLVVEEAVIVIYEGAEPVETITVDGTIDDAYALLDHEPELHGFMQFDAEVVRI